MPSAYQAKSPIRGTGEVVSPSCLGKRLDSKPFLADVAGVTPRAPGPQLSHCHRPQVLQHASGDTASGAVPALLFGPECEDGVIRACTPASPKFPHPWHHSTVGKVLGYKLGVMSKASKPHNEASFTTSHCLSILLTPPRNTGDRGHTPFYLLGPHVRREPAAREGLGSRNMCSACPRDTSVHRVRMVAVD